MKRIVLHVGLPKTGTTSIQDFLAAHSGALAQRGLLFPILRTDLREAGRAQGIGVGWHFALSKVASGRPGVMAPGEWEAWTAEFARFAADPALHTLLLSQEGLFMGGGGKGIDALLASLPPGQLEIVLVLRPALGWLTSLYEQKVRSKVRVGDAAGEFGQAHGYVDRGFVGIVRAIRRQAPDAVLRLLSFDALSSGEGLLVNFARAIGLPEPVIARAAEAPRANPGLPQDMVAVLRTANQAGLDQAGFVAIRGALARAARRRQGKSPRASIFPPALTAAILERYEADRTILRRRFDLELRAEAPAPEADALTLTPDDWARLRAEAGPFLDAAGLAAWNRIRP